MSENDKDIKIPDFAFMRKKDKFILDENRNIIPANLLEWGQFFEKTKERIVKQETINNHRVSTVFLGIDHDLDEASSKPLIFETMVFEGRNEIYCDRYSTWQEAEEGHQKAVEWVNNGCEDSDDDRE